KNLKGWIVTVEGYADSTGNSAGNRSLSERRANAGVRYLGTKHDLPLRRVGQPLGYGSLNPPAADNTRLGPALTLRAETSILLNKSISLPASQNQPASEEQLDRQP